MGWRGGGELGEWGSVGSEEGGTLNFVCYLGGPQHLVCTPKNIRYISHTPKIQYISHTPQIKYLHTPKIFPLLYLYKSVVYMYFFCN